MSNKELRQHQAAYPKRRCCFYYIFAVATLNGCGPLIRDADFARQPESVVAGDLLGPFEGRVVDATTQQPIAKADVFCSWQFTRGIGAPAPVAAVSNHHRTDADGAYRIPRLRELPHGLTNRLAKMSFIVYAPGYIAYRRTSAFGGITSANFYQFKNQIELQRWTQPQSHLNHVMFIGVDAPISRRLRKETWAAAKELTQRHTIRRAIAKRNAEARSQSSSRTNLAAAILDEKLIKETTGYDGSFSEEELADAEDADETWHLRATNRPESFDAALRLWRPSAERFDTTWRSLIAGLDDVERLKYPDGDAYLMREKNIFGLLFAHRATHTLALITCGNQLCKTVDVIQALGNNIYQRLERTFDTSQSKTPGSKTPPNHELAPSNSPIGEEP